MKSWAGGLVGCLLSLSAHAQDAEKPVEIQADLMFGTGSGVTSLSLSYQWAWRFGKKERLRMGVGLRSSLFSASNKFFVTAPAKIVKGVAGPAAFFTEPIKANMDSVLFPSTSIVSFNVLIHISYAISERVRAGFNIDVIGASSGGPRPGTYINGNGAPGGYTQPVTASPSHFNLLLIGENDLGSLNSEFFVTYLFNEKWAVKLGIQHIFMEYTTDTKVQQYPEDNDRFRITPTVACFGVAYTFR